MEVGGWVASELDKIPEEGDFFSYKNLDVVVTKTDSRRVLEIEIAVIPEEVMEEREREEEEREKEKELEKEKSDEVARRMIREISSQIEECLMRMAEVVEIPLGQ